MKYFFRTIDLGFGLVVIGCVSGLIWLIGGME